MSKTAYPSTITPVTITIYNNIPFDNSYKHHTIISDLFTKNSVKLYTRTGTACESFIDRKDYSKVSKPHVYPRWTFTDVFNFDFKNGILGSVTLELTAEQTNTNYMKVVSGSQTWYYFVTSITQSNADTYILSLELDVIMTYQDEFLTGVKDIPIFTKRKHCHRYSTSPSGALPHCADYKNGEDAFSGVKPSIIKEVDKFHYYDDDMKETEGIMWLYICVDYKEMSGWTIYSALPIRDCMYACNNKVYPLCMLAIPLNVDNVIYRNNDHSTHQVIINKTTIMGSIKNLLNNGSVHGAKISPYPPFNYAGDNGSVNYSGGDLYIEGNTTLVIDAPLLKAYKMTIGNTKLIYGRYSEAPVDPSTIPQVYLLTFLSGFVMVSEQTGCNYGYDVPVNLTDIGIKTTLPSISSTRKEDPKLLFSPFRKYMINGQYSSEGFQFYPELFFSEKVYTYSNVDNMWLFQTITTAYIGDSNFYTSFDGSDDMTSNYKYEKLGLSSNVNYVFPCGENALEVFNATQQQSFYTSKVASGITSGITIAGGVASAGLGIAGAVGTLGMSTPMSVGLIASGATAVASGIAGLSSTIASSVAKVEDLKNTPNSINISGSNFLTDECITANYTGLPYLVIMEVNSTIKKSADDFFYAYGYQVARQCLFNTELNYNNNVDNSVDNNLFGRTIFNYIQINEDITNKIVADIPYIVKKKLSNIFNEGITIWTFFNLQGIWNNTEPTSSFYVEKWLFKNSLDNTEI